MNNSTNQDDPYIARSGPMPRPQSVEEGKKMLKKEAFEAPEDCTEVKFTTEEFTSICPRTGQPDFQTIHIIYKPDKLCLESKSVKFYLWSFRDYGAFCESLADLIAGHIMWAIKPHEVKVKIEQNIRGGLALDATAVKTK